MTTGHERRCSVTVTREAAGYYAVTCTCEQLKHVYSSRDAATQAAMGHGDSSGHGYSVTQR